MLKRRLVEMMVWLLTGAAAAETVELVIILKCRKHNCRWILSVLTSSG